MNLNDMGLKNKITLGSCAPIILVAIMGFVAYQSINSLLQTAGWVKHTHEVIEHAMTIEKLIVDMETGERGFLIAGKDEFLEPYNNGKAAMVKVIKETKELVSDNPKQVGRLEVIESAIAGWHQNAANPEIAERRQVVVGAEAAATFKKLQGRTVGKEIFDNLRGALATIDAKFKAAGNLAGRYLLLNTTMDLVNMETGQRGFLLTGQEGSLDPFRNGQKSLTNHLEELKKMSQGAKSNGVTAGDINKVQTLADRWVEEAASPEIDARREMNKVTTVMADVTALIEAGTGKQFMDALRVNLETFKGEELTLMLVREADAAKTAANANKTIIIGTLLTMLVAFIISFWLASKISDALKHVMAKMTRMAEGISSRKLWRSNQKMRRVSCYSVSTTCSPISRPSSITPSRFSPVTPTTTSLALKRTLTNRCRKSSDKPANRRKPRASKPSRMQKRPWQATPPRPIFLPVL